MARAPHPLPSWLGLGASLLFVMHLSVSGNSAPCGALDPVDLSCVGALRVDRFPPFASSNKPAGNSQRHADSGARSSVVYSCHADPIRRRDHAQPEPGRSEGASYGRRPIGDSTASQSTVRSMPVPKSRVVNASGLIQGSAPKPPVGPR